ncbi:MAG: CopY family transcriptional regulator [Planctomycetaceae bacterium]|nr:CopY family transcriptional regulator [Planctomycetaceae bacterium]
MTDPTQLSRRERQIMEIVFARNEASTNDVLSEMDDPPSRTSVRTILRILEEKGYLRHRVEGREYIYRPVQSRKKAAHTALQRVLNTFFEGSLTSAVAMHLTDADDVGPEDLERLEQLITDARRQN